MITNLLIILYLVGCLWLTFELGRDIGSRRFSVTGWGERFSVVIGIAAWPIMLPLAILIGYIRDRMTP